MNEPTEREINRGIAEWMASRNAVTRDDYTTSHDACHQALERMTVEQMGGFGGYIEALLQITGTHSTSCDAFIRATAHQKALSIYRVLEGEGR